MTLVSPILWQTNTIAQKSPPAATQLRPAFRDVTAATGIKFKDEASPTSQKYFIETMQGGVAVFDYDGDSYLDIFFVNGAELMDPMKPGQLPDKSQARFWNRLYRNNGNGTFSDVTEKAGVAGHHYGMGVATGDYDNDGYPDIYLTNFGANILYHNKGNGTFTEVTAKAGVGGGGWSTSACFVDYDRDGFLDLIVARYVDWNFSHNPWCGEHKPGYRSYCHPDNFKPTASLVYHNNRDGTFSDVSLKSGIAAVPGKALGVAFNDFDQDGWLDLLFANDESPQQLFKNNGNGTFTEIAVLQGVAYDENGRVYAGMGLDFQDYDNDGRPDIFINALSNQRYAIYANRGTAFEYVSSQSGLSGITMRYSGWGARFLDYDNDGWKDLFVAQGHVMDNIHLTQPSFQYLQPLLLARNVKGKFQDVSGRSGSAFASLRAGRGAGFGDLDNDGAIDVVVNCNNQLPVVLRNQAGTRHNWLLIHLIGTASNRDGIGAKIRLVMDSGAEQQVMASTAGSYLSASDRRAHFGLNIDKVVRLLEISWPSGVVQRLYKIKANQILKITEPAAQSKQAGNNRLDNGHRGRREKQ
jgi:enediyne biosynthesis protein E4